MGVGSGDLVVFYVWVNPEGGKRICDFWFACFATFWTSFWSFRCGFFAVKVVTLKFEFCLGGPPIFSFIAAYFKNVAVAYWWMMGLVLEYAADVFMLKRRVFVDPRWLDRRGDVFSPFGISVLAALSVCDLDWERLSLLMGGLMLRLPVSGTFSAELSLW